MAQKKQEPKKDFIKHCITQARQGDGNLFDQGGTVRVRLNKYAIIPLEVYRSLLANHRPTGHLKPFLGQIKKVDELLKKKD